MKKVKVKVKSLSLIILSICLMFCLTTSVFATDSLVDITSNTTGKTNTANTAGTITSIDSPTFSTVSETVYAKSNAAVKSSYSTSSSNLSNLIKDQSVTRTGISSNGWSRIQLANGNTGYVQSTYLTTTAPTTSAPITTTNTTNTSVYKNTTTTQNKTTNTLPQTGLEDNTGMFIIIGVCVVAAIYAYRKIREYNI